MSSRRGRRIRFTPNFDRNLKSLRDFYGATRSSVFERLLADLFDRAVPNLSAFPALGRDFFARRPDSVEAQQSLDAVALLTNELVLSLREYVLRPHLVLYSYDESRLIFLAIKHHAQLGYDIRLERDRE